MTRDSIREGLLWPEYEFRPLPSTKGEVLRYAQGEWLPDDGEWDVAFVVSGFGGPLGLGVRMPYQRNIIWKGLTSHWSANNLKHPRLNPWHHMFREGTSEWGGDWGGSRHPNSLAMDAAMNKCCSMHRCANGRGPEFVIGDPWIAAGLLREVETKTVVQFPEILDCAYCGLDWDHALRAKAQS